jgi:hypothetical protein
MSTYRVWRIPVNWEGVGACRSSSSRARASGSEHSFTILFLAFHPLQITEPVPGILISWQVQCKCPKCLCLAWLEGKTGLISLGSTEKRPWNGAQVKKSGPSGKPVSTCYHTPIHRHTGAEDEWMSEAAGFLLSRGGWGPQSPSCLLNIPTIVP